MYVYLSMYVMLCLNTVWYFATGMSRRNKRNEYWMILNSFVSGLKDLCCMRTRQALFIMMNLSPRACMYAFLNGGMEGRDGGKDGRMDGWIDRSIHVCLDECLDGCMHG